MSDDRGVPVVRDAGTPNPSGDFAYVHIDRPANHHAWLSDGPVRDDALCHYGCGLRYGDWKAMQSGRTEGQG